MAAPSLVCIMHTIASLVSSASMPMPHRTQMQVIKRRLVGKEGSERVRELRAILGELPNYRSGPYADIRKWVNNELESTRSRSRVVHRDSIAVRRAEPGPTSSRAVCKKTC